MYSTERHHSIFSAADHEIPAVIFGCGATGSNIALQLAAMGCKHIYVFDDDVVEPHNLPNQIFMQEHIGKRKVDAFIDMAKQKLGDAFPQTIEVFPRRVPDLFIESEEILDYVFTRPCVVFLAVDTMRDRQRIVEYLDCVREHIVRIIDTRMASSYGNLFSYNPNSPEKRAEYSKTIVSDAVTEMSPCGAAITVGPTVLVTASLALWEYINVCTEPMGTTNRINFYMRPYGFHVEDWINE